MSTNNYTSYMVHIEPDGKYIEVPFQPKYLTKSEVNFLKRLGLNVLEKALYVKIPRGGVSILKMNEEKLNQLKEYVNNQKPTRPKLLAIANKLQGVLVS